MEYGIRMMEYGHHFKYLDIKNKDLNGNTIIAILKIS